MKTIDFNNLPQAIEYLVEEVGAIKIMLQKREIVNEPISKNLNFEGARSFVIERGIPMSQSRLYKLVSSNNCHLPFHRVGGRLLFFSHELENWCDTQISLPINSKSFSFNSIVASAQTKTKLL